MHINLLTYRRNANIKTDGQYLQNSSDLSCMHQQTNQRISNVYSPSGSSLPPTPLGRNNENSICGTITDDKCLDAPIPIEYQSNSPYALASMDKFSFSSLQKQVSLVYKLILALCIS